LGRAAIPLSFIDQFNFLSPDETRAKALVEHAWAKQLRGHLVREIGAVVDGAHSQSYSDGLTSDFA
jgi:hypothetical protein